MVIVMMYEVHGDSSGLLRLYMFYQYAHELYSSFNREMKIAILGKMFATQKSRMVGQSQRFLYFYFYFILVISQDKIINFQIGNITLYNHKFSN